MYNKVLIKTGMDPDDPSKGNYTVNVSRRVNHTLIDQTMSVFRYMYLSIFFLWRNDL